MSDISELTVQQIADHMTANAALGRGAWPVRLDRRGLGFLRVEHKVINLVIPIDGDQVDREEKTVFLSARF